MQFVWAETNVQSASESSFSATQIQKQVVSSKSSEMYLSIDIRYVGAVTKGSTWKIPSETLRIMEKSAHLKGPGPVNSWAWPTYVFWVLKSVSLYRT